MSVGPLRQCEARDLRACGRRKSRSSSDLIPKLSPSKPHRLRKGTQLDHPGPPECRMNFPRALLQHGRQHSNPTDSSYLYTHLYIYMYSAIYVYLCVYIYIYIYVSIYPRLRRHPKMDFTDLPLGASTPKGHPTLSPTGPKPFQGPLIGALVVVLIRNHEWPLVEP